MDGVRSGESDSCRVPNIPIYYHTCWPMSSGCRACTVHRTRKLFTETWHAGRDSAAVSRLSSKMYAVAVGSDVYGTFPFHPGRTTRRHRI